MKLDLPGCRISLRAGKYRLLAHFHALVVAWVKHARHHSWKHILTMEMQVLKSWNTPSSDHGPGELRPKEFRLVRFEDGLLAVCKMDSNAEYMAHEADILKRLASLDCVPALVRQTPEAIYTRYVEGKLLPKAIAGLGPRESLKMGLQTLEIIARIHGKGVVHGDIRPWNFIYGRDARLYLIDFEYAYAKDQEAAWRILSVHHGPQLKTAISDWDDAFHSIGTVWKSSGHWAVKFVLAYVPLSLHWMIYPLIQCLRVGKQRARSLRNICNSRSP